MIAGGAAARARSPGLRHPGRRCSVPRPRCSSGSCSASRRRGRPPAVSSAQAMASDGRTTTGARRPVAHACSSSARWRPPCCCSSARACCCAPARARERGPRLPGRARADDDGGSAGVAAIRTPDRCSASIERSSDEVAARSRRAQRRLGHARCRSASRTIGSLSFEIVGDPPPSQRQRPAADYQIVSPSYFETVDLPIVGGPRVHRSRHARTASPVCIVNEAFVRRAPRRTLADRRARRVAALGRRGAAQIVREIVGVARQVKGRPDETEDLVQVYVPMAQGADRRHLPAGSRRPPGAAEALAPVDPGGHRARRHGAAGRASRT